MDELTGRADDGHRAGVVADARDLSRHVDGAVMLRWACAALTPGEGPDVATRRAVSTELGRHPSWGITFLAALLWSTIRGLPSSHGLRMLSPVVDSRVRGPGRAVGPRCPVREVDLGQTGVRLLAGARFDSRWLAGSGIDLYPSSVSGVHPATPRSAAALAMLAAGNASPRGTATTVARLWRCLHRVHGRAGALRADGDLIDAAGAAIAVGRMQPGFRAGGMCAGCAAARMVVWADRWLEEGAGPSLPVGVDPGCGEGGDFSERCVRCGQRL